MQCSAQALYDPRSSLTRNIPKTGQKYVDTKLKSATEL